MPSGVGRDWIPAFAGMTISVGWGKQILKGDKPYRVGIGWVKRPGEWGQKAALDLIIY